MTEDYLARLEQARELIQLAGETAEGRAAARGWLQQVQQAVGEPDAVLDPAARQRAAQVRAAQQMGYDVALSESGPAGIELYPADIGLGHYDGGLYPGPGAPDNGGQRMQYDEAAIARALAADEIARLSIMAMGGPQRPQYAGLTFSGDSPADEADADDLVAATMQLSARTEGRATYAECAAAVDELSAGEPSRRAGALVDLAHRFPGGSPAADELELDLARQREVDRLTGQPGTDPRVADIVRRHSEMLGDTPRRGMTHTAVIRDEDPADRRQPGKGGATHPEVERLLRDHGLLLGLDPNSSAVPKSAAVREREERRAHHARPGRTIEELHRSAQRSATNSRG